MLRILVTFMLLGQFGSGIAGECNLPEYKEDEINWNMIDGLSDWYHILNTQDAVEGVVKCFSLSGFIENDDDIFVTFSDIRGTGKKAKLHGHIPVHWERKANSYYRYDTKYEDLWLDEMTHGIDILNPKFKATLTEAKQEVAMFYNQDLTFYTDYKNFFMGMQCTPEGKKLIWVHSKNPYPETEDILRVHNKLVEIGEGWEKVTLFLAGCRNLELPPSDNKIN